MFNEFARQMIHSPSMNKTLWWFGKNRNEKNEF